MASRCETPTCSFCFSNLFRTKQTTVQVITLEAKIIVIAVHRFITVLPS
jgi:hypothetical protein